MTIRTPFKYGFDPSGQDPQNLILREIKSLPATNHIVFALDQGLFYTDTIVIQNSADGSVLSRGTDYEFIHYEPYIKSLTGLEAAAGINIKDKNFIGSVEVTYQAVGGAEGLPIGLINTLLEAIETANSDPTIDFETQVKNKPIYFTPSPHKHALADMDDLDKLSEKFDDVLNALILREPMQESGNNFQEQIDRMLAVLGSMRQSINIIIADKGYGDRFAELANRLEAYPTAINDEVTVGAISNHEIGRFSLMDYNTVRGIATLNSAGETHSVDFMAVGRIGGIPAIQEFGQVSTGGGVIALRLDVVRVGTDMILYARSTLSGDVAAKYYALL